MLYLSGIILSFFLAFVLITKKRKSHADYVLVAWLLTIGLHLLTFYLLYTGNFAQYPTLISLGFPLPLAHGPFLYLYTRLQTSSAPFNSKQLLHFVPVVLSYILFLPFYILPFEQKVEIIMLKGQGYELHMLINLYAIYASGIIYTSLSLARLLQYRRNLVNQFSNTEKINFNWLLYLIIWMVIIWIVILFVQEDKLIFGAAALFVLWLGYFSIKQVQVFSQVPAPVIPSATGYDGQSNAGDTKFEASQADSLTEESSLKYQKSNLSEEDALMIHERLQQLMSEQKPYVNPDLTLTELAKSLDVHPNHLSQVINSREKRNFYDLINEKRVQEFIKLVSQPVSQQYTLLGIAYDCGFNSKASFNRNFKKCTGLTPRDYLKSKLMSH